MIRPLPTYMLGYEGYTVYYFNGNYTIAGKPSLTFLNMTAVKKQIDTYVQEQLLRTNQSSENQTISDAQTTNAEG